MTTPPVLSSSPARLAPARAHRCYDRLVDEVPDFKRVVTTTTRAPRTGEEHGVHYHFFSPDEFERGSGGGRFPWRWAWVHGERKTAMAR